MEMRGMMGGFYRISEWIMRFSAINLLWFFCALPIILSLFMQLSFMSQLLEQAEIELFTFYDLIFSPFILFSLVIAPFTFYPATAAMVSVARKWIQGEVDVPLFRSFFRFFKTNYKYAMFGGLFFNFMFVVMLINVQFYADQKIIFLYYTFWVATFILLAILINFFCYLSHFEMKFWQLVRNSALFTIARPFNTLFILAANAAVMYFCFTKLNYFLVVFFMGSIMAYLTFWSFNRNIIKIQEKSERLAQEAEEAKASTDSTDQTEA